MQNNHNNGYDDNDYTHQQDYYEKVPNQDTLDPAVERVRRKLMRLMIISVTITILLVVAVFVAVIYKATRTSQTPPVTQGEVSLVPTDLNATATQTVGNIIAQAEPPATIIHEIDLPVGTRILSQSLSGDLISLETLAPSGGTELVIYNYKQGQIIARLSIPSNDMSSPR